MKNKIKEIKIEDCVECYVSDYTEPKKESNKKESDKVFVIGKTEDGQYVTRNGHKWKYAIPCEELDNPHQNQKECKIDDSSGSLQDELDLIDNDLADLYRSKDGNYFTGTPLLAQLVRELKKLNNRKI